MLIERLTDLQDSAGETVLHVAAAKGFVEILVIYLERFRYVLF